MSTQTAVDTDASAKIAYAPPSHPPPLRKVHLDDRIACSPQLSIQGWTALGLKINKAEEDPLRDGLDALLQASRRFFDQPIEEKQRWVSKLGSEEGWSRVEGEKEMITLRSSNNTPDVLLEPVTALWALCGTLLNNIIGRIAESLALPPEALQAFSKPVSTFQPARTATMLRLFRYEGDSMMDKVVSERTWLQCIARNYHCCCFN